MQHLTIKAAATTTSRGVFSALAATYSVDRGNERIIPGAFEKTISAWQASTKQIPLHWEHESSAESIIGYIDPASMRETDDGLYVEGKLDIKTSDVAKEAWRSMKNNAVSLSFGYLAKTRKGKGGVIEITEVDLFEVSIVAAPMNADTRILSLKAAQQADLEATESVHPTDAEPEPLDARELRKRTFDAAHEVAKDHSVVRKAGPVEEPPDESEEVEPDGAEVPSPPEVTIEEGAITAPVVTPEKATTVHTVKGGVHTVTQVSAVEDGSTEEPKVEKPEAKVAPQDPLRKRTYEVALGISNGGMRVRKYIEPEPDPEPLDAAALRRRSDELALDIARG